MYSRAFLEGVLEEEDLDGFRQERSHVVDGKIRALSSYPHPRLMPNFWPVSYTHLDVYKRQTVISSMSSSTR